MRISWTYGTTFNNAYMGEGEGGFINTGLGDCVDNAVVVILCCLEIKRHGSVYFDIDLKKAMTR